MIELIEKTYYYKKKTIYIKNIKNIKRIDFAKNANKYELNFDNMHNNYTFLRLEIELT